MDPTIPFHRNRIYQISKANRSFNSNDRWHVRTFVPSVSRIGSFPSITYMQVIAVC